MKRKSALGIMAVMLVAVWVIGCGSSDDAGSWLPTSKINIYGTSGNTPAGADLSRSAQMIWTEPQGGAQSVEMRFYRIWIGQQPDCSDIDPNAPIADFTSDDDGYRVFDLVNDTLPIVSAALSAGTYNCVVFHVGAVLRVYPDEVARDAFNSCTTEEQKTAICHNDEGEDYIDIDGGSYRCESSHTTFVDEEHYLYMSTDPSGIMMGGQEVHRHQILQLGGGITVPGNAYLIMNFDDKVNEVTIEGEAPVCAIDGPTIGFSMLPTVESIKSWRSIGSPVTNYDPYAIRFAVDRDFIIVADIGDGDVRSRMYSRHKPEWVSMSHKEGTAYVAGSIGVARVPEKAYIVWIDQNPPSWQCKVRSQWSDVEGVCSIVGLPSGNMSETTRVQIRMVSDDNYVYLAFGETGAGRPVKAHRISVEDIENVTESWMLVGGGSAGDSTVVPHGHEIAAYDGTLYVATYLQGTGITVQKSVAGGDWQPVGDGFSLSDNVTSMSISARFGKIYLSYVINNADRAHAFTFDGADWQRVGAPGATGGNAEHLRISSSSLRPYMAFQNASNSNYPNLYHYKYGAWSLVPNSTIEVLHSVIYDFTVYAGVPYLLYKHGGGVNVKRFDSTDYGF